MPLLQRLVVGWAVRVCLSVVPQMPLIDTVPVPVKVLCRIGLVASLLVICRVALFAPMDVGAKVTLTVQLEPAAKVGVRLAQGVAPPAATVNCVESVPVKVTTVTVTEFVLLLFSVKVIGED